ncbi:hypothetical protein FRX31_005859 [Thalictrum thalictroides]|uniref:Bifunctional inhibitor/lipid-transfer protein/seed storage 2S albumin superfamily protein n=1 Tax=Thalictrum thalictroides TaxID=46969 RepID=A0A7J6X6T5_THATH|nr:hypothetical protein FRX31_005859 [Thalictrum thalictroides]
MRRIQTVILATLAIFSVLIPEIICLPNFGQPVPNFGQPIPNYGQPRPLCLSQFALVNQACSSLPINVSPVTPVVGAPPDDTDEPNEPDQKGAANGHEQHRREHHEHHRRHRHHRHHENSKVAENCCRWLKNLDDACVCELLFRLPPFLRRHSHSYVISLGEDCVVSYKCDGGLC